MENYEIIYKDIEKVKDWEDIVKKVFSKCFEVEGLLDSKLYITVTFTNPENIQNINKEYRNIEQATEYGHSFEREFSYMLVHGFYHLMGYDHMEESDKKEMRAKEENILNTLTILR